MMLSKSLFCLILLMTRSTCTLSLAMACVSLTWYAGICFCLDRKGGQYTLHLQQSVIRKPLSTITAMSSVNFSAMPDCLNSSLSLTEPAYRLEMNVTGPCGAMPTRAFIIQWDLYEEYISLWRRGEDDVWHLSSVQSRIIWVSEKSLNSSGR